MPHSHVTTNTTYDNYMSTLASSLSVNKLDTKKPLHKQRYKFDEMDMVSSVVELEKLYDTNISDDFWETSWYNTSVDDLYVQLNKLAKY